jgi:PAS domain S-box-containing protein
MGGSSRPTGDSLQSKTSAAPQPERTVDSPPRNEGHFPSLIENIMDVIMVLNGDGTMRSQSPSIRNVTGYEPEERQGKSIFDLIHPDDQPDATSAFGQLLDKQIATLDMELRIRHKDGSWRLVEAKAKNLMDDPTVAGIVANFHDLTARGQGDESFQITDDYIRPFIQTFSWM